MAQYKCIIKKHIIYTFSVQSSFVNIHEPRFIDYHPYSEFLQLDNVVVHKTYCLTDLSWPICKVAKILRFVLQFVSWTYGGNFVDTITHLAD